MVRTLNRSATRAAEARAFSSPAADGFPTCAVAPLASSSPERCQAMVPSRKLTTRVGNTGVDDRLRTNDAPSPARAVHDDRRVR